jgi:hypothetical protein
LQRPCTTAKQRQALATLFGFRAEGYPDLQIALKAFKEKNDRVLAPRFFQPDLYVRARCYLRRLRQ